MTQTGTGSGTVAVVPVLPAWTVYGTAVAVAAQVQRITKFSVFTELTLPTLAMVEHWLDQVSSAINVALAQQGYSVPVTLASVVPALDMFVETQTAEFVKRTVGLYQAPGGNANTRVGSYPAAITSNLSESVGKFITENADAFERMGLTRSGLQLWALVTPGSNL